MTKVGAMFVPMSADEILAADSAPKAGRKTPIVPVPADAPPMTFSHPRHGAPTRYWPYHDAEGRLVGYVCRWNIHGGDGKPTKEVLPVTFCDLGDGRRGWRSKGMPAPRPLLGLPEIRARADAPILICEGEKTRDAAAVLFPDVVATTPAHGAKSPKLTDFGPCAGRAVVIATDYDQPGRTDDRGRPLHPGEDFGDAVAKLVRQAGAVEVLHLPAERLGFQVWRDGSPILRPEPIPDGWDLADALAEGWTAAALAGMRSDPAFLTPYLPADTRNAERVEADRPLEERHPRQWPFRLVPGGVEKRVERVDRETGTTSIEWRWFCSALEIGAETRSAEGEEWGRLLKITDRDGRLKSWAMPMAMLAGDGTAYRERLLGLGLIMAPGAFAREALHEYISTARPDTKARCVGRVGWHALSFTFSNETMGPPHA